MNRKFIVNAYLNCMKKGYTILFVLLFFINGFVLSQDCESKVKLVLNNISNGGFYRGQTVELTSISTKKVYKVISDAKGEAVFLLPCDERFEVHISNYAAEDEIKSPPRSNSSSTRNYSYESDMLEKRKTFAMNEAERVAVDKAISILPDTTYISSSIMRAPRDINNYSSVDITLIGLKNQFLVDEEIVFTGRNRNKSFKASTNSQGRALFYLPKGDIYTVNFEYHHDYRIEEVEYSKGTSKVRLDITYMGKKEYLRRKKEEEERMALEKIAAANALAGGGREYIEDKTIEKVLGRNKWDDQFLISDVSSEMLTYAMKLANYYKANRATGKNYQFVLYYNGQKQAGSESGSAFHLTNPDYEKLVSQINYVHANRGLENAKDDIKGLIVGKGAKETYKDVILFVDKDAHLYDYQFFKQLKVPVHVVLCVDPRRPNPQHLTIAWKTKGSVHTLSGDYPNIGKLSEGDVFEMEGYKYKIMGGEFIFL